MLTGIPCDDIEHLTAIKNRDIKTLKKYIFQDEDTFNFLSLLSLSDRSLEPLFSEQIFEVGLAKFAISDSSQSLMRLPFNSSLTSKEKYFVNFYRIAFGTGCESFFGAMEVAKKLHKNGKNLKAHWILNY